MQDIVLPDTLDGSHNLINQLILVIRQQHKQLEDINSRFAELEARLNQNSSNSSRPPSSDFGKNTPKKTTKPGLPKEKKSKADKKTTKVIHSLD